MFSLLKLALFFAAGSSTASVPFEMRNALSVDAACASGVHIITARGSNENPGEGSMGSVSTAIKNKIAGSDSVAVPYPATLDNYTTSEHYGTTNMTKLVQDYSRSCPSSKIVLMGYSQGGQVALDTLCGTAEGSDFPTTSPLASQYTQNIIAVIAFGDPSHQVGKSYDVGTSTNHGVFIRTNNGCDPYAKIIQSYCDSNDTFCDSGSSLQVHGSYVNKYTTAVTSFVVNKYNGK